MVVLDAVALFVTVVLVIDLPAARRGAGRDAVAALRREGRENAAANGRARFGPGGESMVVARYGGSAMAYVDPAFAPYFISVLPFSGMGSVGGR